MIDFNDKRQVAKAIQYTNVNPNLTRDGMLKHLETCPYYTVEKYDIHGTWDHVFEAGFVNASVIEGEGSINGRKIKKGDHFIIPADFGTCSFEGNLSLICS